MQFGILSFGFGFWSLVFWLLALAFDLWYFGFWSLVVGAAADLGRLALAFGFWYFGFFWGGRPLVFWLLALAFGRWYFGFWLWLLLYDILGFWSLACFVPARATAGGRRIYMVLWHCDSQKHVINSVF